MSSTSQPTTFSDIYTSIMNRVRVDTSLTATSNQAKAYANVALTDMHIGTQYHLPWAERQGTLITQPYYTTGTVTITKGSTTLTGASTAWNTANSFGQNNVTANGKLTIAGGTEVYTVSSIASDTSLTLTQRFIRDDVAAVNYVYWQDEYSLASDFLRPIEWTSFDLNSELTFPSRSEFYRRFPRNSQPGRPQWAMLIDKAFSGSTARVRRLVLAPPPKDVKLYPYRYITSNLAVTAGGVESTAMVNDTDEPIVPLPYRQAIVLHALWNWYRDKKDDSRSQEAKAAYDEFMLRTLGDVEIGDRTPSLQPHMSDYVSAVSNPYTGRGRGGYYTLGDRFDRGE